MRATRLFAVLIAVGAVGAMALTSAYAAPTAQDAAGITGQRYVFVVNRIGARSDALASVRNALGEFADRALRAGDEVMIVEIGYSTRVLQEFSDSKETTAETIRGLTLLPIGLSRRVETRQLYETMHYIADTLRDLPGRKAVILASSEPNVIRSGVHYVRDTTDALNMANAVVYSLDLDVFHRPFSTLVARSGLAGLALDTGGRYFHTQSRVSFLPSLFAVADELRLERAD